MGSQYGPLASLNGSEPWAPTLKVIYNGARMDPELGTYTSPKAQVNPKTPTQCGVWA